MKTMNQGTWDEVTLLLERSPRFWDMIREGAAGHTIPETPRMRGETRPGTAGPASPARPVPAEDQPTEAARVRISSSVRSSLWVAICQTCPKGSSTLPDRSP